MLLASELSALDFFLLVIDLDATLILLGNLFDSEVSEVNIFPDLSSNSTFPSALSSKKWPFSLLPSEPIILPLPFLLSFSHSPS